MGTIFQSLRKWFGSAGAITQQTGVQLGAPLVRTSAPSRDYGIDGALQLSSVWAAIELLVDNVASLPAFTYYRSPGPDGHKRLARDELVFRILHDEPNRRATAMEFFQFLLMSWLFRGNAYARVIRDDRGDPIELWPLSPDQVEVEVLRDRSIVYRHTYDGVVSLYSEASIFHWRDKGNGIIGMDRLSFMRGTISNAHDISAHSSRVFAKSAKRPGVFMIDKLLSEKQREEIRRNYRGLVEGSEDDLLVLEAGAKFEPLSMSPADLQMMEARRFSVEEVGRWFGVPAVLINDTTRATTWGTGIEQIIEGFYKFRLRPMLASLEQAIELRVLSPDQRRRLTVEFSLDALLRGSLKDRLETGAKAVQNGLMTRNEWRQLENLPPMPGGDVLTAQSNLLPITKLGENSGAGRGAAGGNDNGPSSQDALAQ